MDQDDGPHEVSFEDFLNHKRFLKNLMKHVDLDNVWIVFALVVVFEKKELDKLLDSPNFSDGFKEFVEMWANANPADRKRELLKQLRDLDLKPFTEHERELMNHETPGHPATPDHDTHEQVASGLQNYDQEMKKTLARNKIEIEELKRSLSLASDEKNELERNLETKIQETDDLKVSIKEKDNETDYKIGELQNLIHEKEEELLSSQQLLKKKEKEVNTLRERITAKETELASFRKLSEEQLQEIVALKLKLTDNQKDIAEKESMIKSANEELSSVRLLLSQTQEELKLQKNDLEEKFRTQYRISRMKDIEIESLKARLHQRKEQDMSNGTKWSESEVRLTSPSVEECKDVLTIMDDTPRHVYLSDSSSDVAQLLVVPLLQKRHISSLYIFSTPLTRDFIALFSSQVLDNNTLESLYLNHNSIDDGGVITLMKSLKHNKKLLYLSLDFNTGITSLSVPSLAEFIRINCTLSVLYVSHTSIDSKGMLELVGSLIKFNTKLGKIVVDQTHKAMCTEFIGKTNRLDFSYTTPTAYEYAGITKITNLQ